MKETRYTVGREGGGDERGEGIMAGKFATLADSVRFHLQTAPEHILPLLDTSLREVHITHLYCTVYD